MIDGEVLIVLQPERGGAVTKRKLKNNKGKKKKKSKLLKRIQLMDLGVH